MPNMILTAPEYYRDFHCIADKCEHSCCIGWRVSVDEGTLERYKSMPKESADKITSTLATDDDGVYVKLLGDGRCPHLSDCGLCRIITEHGEEYTSEICREHPRFYNVTASGVEVGIGASCEEAARLILSSDRYMSTVTVGNTDHAPFVGELDTRAERERTYRILRDRSIPYEDRLRAIASTYGLSPDMLTDGEWRRIFSELEYLDEKDKALFMNYKSEVAGVPERELERYLAYLIYRHASAAESVCEYRARICLSLLLERLAATLISNGVSANEAARIISLEIEYSEDNTEALIFEIECLEI